jgi:hypothetical protein
LALSDDEIKYSSRLCVASSPCIDLSFLIFVPEFYLAFINAQSEDVKEELRNIMIEFRNKENEYRVYVPTQVYYNIQNFKCKQYF